MGCCGGGVPAILGGGPPPRPYDEPPQPVLPPDSPTWKLPPFPAPALPPLTRQNKVIITCSQFLEEPEEAAKLKRQILNGSGEALSVVFDVGDYLEQFIPEVKKIFSLAFSISSIELHTANLDMEAEFLQSFLETLPSHGELKAFSLVTARDTPLMFVTVSGLMYRNPNLVAIRLWGPDLTIAGTGNQYYPQCQLLRADFAHCTFHPEQLNVLLGSSKETLLCLKFEKLMGVSGSFIARAVKNYGRRVQMLTILLPNESDSEVDLEATYLVGDTASQFPRDLKYLHLGGLAASDNMFMVNPTGDQRIGETPTSHLDSVVALRLDDCPRLTVNGLFGAMRHGHLRSLLRLHAYWLENEGAWSDTEVWKQFAASQDVRIDTSQDGLVWLTVTKERPSERPELPEMPAHPGRAAVVDPRTVPRVHNVARGGVPNTFPPSTHLRPGITSSHGNSHRSRQGSNHRRRVSNSSDSSSTSSSSSSSSGSSSSGSSSDDSAYHSARSKGHSKGSHVTQTRGNGGRRR